MGLKPGCYQEELNEINRKSRIVYSRYGIYPFLRDDLTDNSMGHIPGFQIERLYPTILEDK